MKRNRKESKKQKHFKLTKHCWPRTWYYGHPIKYIKDIIKYHKWANQRKVRSWADCDVWEFFNWFTTVIPEMLDQFGNTATSFPDRLVPTIEQWQDTLHTLAKHLRNANEDLTDFPKVNVTTPQEMLQYDKAKGLYMQRELSLGLSMLETYFYDLWD